MPVVNIYQTQAPNLYLPIDQPSRTVFQFFNQTPTGDSQQIAANLGVASAQLVIYVDAYTTVPFSLQGQANGDFIFYVNPIFLSLAAGIYQYAIFLDNDYVPFVSASIGVGYSRQQDNVIAVMDASRNAIKINNSILENPQFADNTSVTWIVTTDPVSGVATISANSLAGAPGQNGKSVLSGYGAPDPVYTGVIGDFYIDLNNYNFYGPLTSYGWGLPVSLVGPAGAVGPAGPVNIATQAQTDAGTDATDAIVPLTYQQGITNRLASQADAQAGTDNSRLMTALRVIESIQTFAPSVFLTYWPSAPVAQGSVFNSWPSLMAAVASLPAGQAPHITIFENATLSTIGMPAAGWDLRGGTLSSPSIATGMVTLSVPDGVILRDLFFISDGLTVDVSPVSIAPITFSAAAGSLPWVLVIDRGAKLVNTGTSAAIVSPGAASETYVVLAQFSATINVPPNDTAAWVKMQGTDILIFSQAQNGPFGKIPDGAAVGTCGGLIFQNGIESDVPNLSGLTSGFTQIYNGTKSVNLNYDDTLQLPTSGKNNAQSVIDWLKTQIGGGGGGGGGPYPDKVFIDTASLTLSSAVQGWHLMNAANMTYTLPTTAVDGETYILGFITVAADSVSVVFTGMCIGQASPMTINKPWRFMAFNFAPYGLIWIRTDACGSTRGAWAGNNQYNTAIMYDQGEIIFQGASCYMSKTNVNQNHSLSDTFNWFKLY